MARTWRILTGVPIAEIVDFVRENERDGQAVHGKRSARQCQNLRKRRCQNFRNPHVLEGARVRFRPILMTDLMMIVGVLPLALRGGTGSELHRPLAIVYIGHFTGALLLRRFIVPVLYEAMASVFDREGRPVGTAEARGATVGR